MAFVVTTYASEEALAAAINGTVVTHKSEQALEDYIEANSGATLTALTTKGAMYTTVLDADVTPNTLIGLGAKGGKFTVVIETP